MSPARNRSYDWFMIGIVVMLFVVGFLFIYSSCYDQKTGATDQNFYLKQLVWIGLGLVVFVVTCWVDYRKIVSLAPLFYVVAVLLLMTVLSVGKVRLGAQRWISIGGFILQPSEITKVFLIIVMARVLTRLQGVRTRFRFVLLPLIIAGVPLALIIVQPDLGTAMVCVPVVFGMLYVGGAQIRHLFAIVFAGMLCLPFMWMKLHDYQRNRILIFLNPKLDPLGAGYTAIQSRIAVGSGGIAGKGWRKGSQTQLNFLPEKHTDFIFSVIAEERGFLGGVLVVSLYWIFIISAVNASIQSQDMVGRLVCAGVALLFFVQVMINIGMTIGVMPITGVPLPLISYGGSSFLTSMFAFGLVENIYARRFSQ